MEHKSYILILIAILLFSASSEESFQATFTPRLSISEEFTDNLFLSHINPETEYITNISPAFSLGLLGKTSGLDLSYNPSYAYYNEYDEKNAWRHTAVLSGWAQLTRYTRIQLRDYFIHTDDPLPEEDIALRRTTGPDISIQTEDPLSEEDTTSSGTTEPDYPIDSTERRGRSPYTRNVADINFTQQFGESDSFRLGYTNIFLENEDPTLEDNTTNEPSAGITYWFLPQWGIDIDISYTRGEWEVSDDIDRFYGTVRFLRQFTRHLDGYVRYSHTMVEYDGVTEDDRTYNPSIGIDYLIEKDISFKLDVGYFINDFDLRPDQSGMTGEAILTKRFRRGSINFSALGGYDYALYGTTQRNGFEKFAEGSISATYNFTRYVSGNINGAYRYSDYVDQGYQNDRAGGGVGLTITPLSWMSIGLRYSYRMLESTIDTNEYQENRALLSITLAPSVPYRTSNY